MSCIWQSITGEGFKEEAGKSWNSIQTVVRVGRANVKHCRWLVQVLGEDIALIIEKDNGTLGIFSSV